MKIAGFCKLRNEVIREGNVYSALETLARTCDCGVICDDASTDGTADIVEEFVRSNRGWILLKLSSEEQAFAMELVVKHDTLDGVEATRAAAESLGVKVITGCEISTLFQDMSIHILVYFIEDGDTPFHKELASLQKDRIERNKAVALRLGELGLPITYEDMVSEASREASVGRPHIASLLVRCGAATTIPDAFDKWLGQGKPAYIPKARLSPMDVVELAKSAHAVTSLAHPFTLGLSTTNLLEAVRELKNAGCSGIEVFYANYSPSQRHELLQISQKLDLVPTGGSDYHGTIKPGLMVGKGRGDLEVPDETLTLLERRRG